VKEKHRSIKMCGMLMMCDHGNQPSIRGHRRIWLHKPLAQGQEVFTQQGPGSTWEKEEGKTDKNIV